MDFEAIERLVRLFEDSTLTELEIKEEKSHIRIRRAASGQEVQPSLSANAAPAARPKQNTEPDPAKVFHSPMVGSFYRASSEEEAPFVEEGQQVKEGDPLCVIEAMKMLNLISCDRSGIIEEVLVAPGQSVEFGQPLFIIAA